MRTTLQRMLDVMSRAQLEALQREIGSRIAHKDIEHGVHPAPGTDPERRRLRQRYGSVRE